MKESLRQALLIAGKDLRIFFADRGALVFALVFPFVFVLIFSTVMGSPTGETDEPFTVYVTTAEKGAAPVTGDDGAPASNPGEAGDKSGGAGFYGAISQLIIDGLTAADAGLDVQEADPDRAREALETEKIGGYLFFPEDFTKRIWAGEPTALTVYYRPDSNQTRTALNAVARAIAADITAHHVAYQAFYELSGGQLPSDTGDVRAGMAGGQVPVLAEDPQFSLVYEKVGEVEPVGAADVLIPGYLTMFVFFALALTAETIVGEKENYTLERLTASGASQLAIVVGKYLGSFGRGLVQVAAFWLAGVLIFDVDMGRYPGTVVLVSVLVALASSGVGVFLATLAKSRKGAAAMGVFVSLSAAAFGGSMWPLFIMPQWLQNAAKITPHAWANLAFNKLMLFGATPTDVGIEMAALVAFGLLFMTLGVWRFRVG